MECVKLTSILILWMPQLSKNKILKKLKGFLMMYLRATKGGFIKGTILQTFLPTAPNLYNKIPIKVGDHLNTKHDQSKQMQLTFKIKRKINYVCIVNCQNKVWWFEIRTIIHRNLGFRALELNWFCLGVQFLIVRNEENLGLVYLFLEYHINCW